MRYFYVWILICCVAGILIWMVVTLRKLAKCQSELAWAEKQLAVYRAPRTVTLDEQERQRRQAYLEISEETWDHAAAAYNHCLRRPMTRCMARMVGLRRVEPRCEIKQKRQS